MAYPHRLPLDDYELIDRYSRSTGRVLLTGTQAIVRILLDQRDRDIADGLNTAGFVSGYRGSPLGGVDAELWRNKERLKQRRIEFLPAVNEDLAATAVLGSQQVETNARREVEGVFGLWYGKGPGVDRSGDALKHGNAYGSSPHGGVLVVAGDDHGCVSSSMPHQSDVAFMAWFMPTLQPVERCGISRVRRIRLRAEPLFGHVGRVQGNFGDGGVLSASVELAAAPRFRHARIREAAGRPALSLARSARPADRARGWSSRRMRCWLSPRPTRSIAGSTTLPEASYGIVTTGKGHLDLMEALELLGLMRPRAGNIGIDIYKVGMVWPLAHHDALEFVREKREILVVEEKRGIIESQFKEYFYDYPGHKPERMVGKYDENNTPLVPWIGELSPRLLAPIVARRLDAMFPGLDLGARAASACAAARPRSSTIARRDPHPVFLLRLPAQHIDQSA